MTYTSQPGSVHGEVTVPGSKSATHRALLLAALDEEGGQVRGTLDGLDTRATRNCLASMGRPSMGDSTVRFEPGTMHGTRRLHCANSGTTLRLFMAQASRFATACLLDGDASLRRRPNGPLADALRGRGATVSGRECPLTVRGPIRGGTWSIDARLSSQFASALMLTLPFLEEDSVLHVEGSASTPYLEMTASMMAQAGLRMRQEDAWLIPGGQRPSAVSMDVEADWSSAAFPLVAGAIAGDVTVRGLDDDSVQGDRAIMEALAAFGADVDGHRVRQRPLVSPGIVDVAKTPDMFPALCVLAACAEGATRFTGGAALRIKESDRIQAMAQGLQRLGIRVQEHEDGVTVHGGTLQGGTVTCQGDHRIHMAFVIAGLASTGPVIVDEPECVAVSFPGFHSMITRLQEAA